MFPRHCSAGLSQPYNEQAFRYLLAIERQRFERSGRRFLLLLMALAAQPGQHRPIELAVARRLFSSLQLCLRETDFTGWYRDHRVAGAVLTELGDRTSTAVAHLVGQTIGPVLRERFPPELARAFQMRVYEDAEPDTIDSKGTFTLEV